MNREPRRPAPMQWAESWQAIVCMLLVAAGIAWWKTAAPAELACRSGDIPNPAWVIVLPDGKQIAAKGMSLDYNSRTIVVTEDAEVFCDGCE